jgi:hypothetical protein
VNKCYRIICSVLFSVMATSGIAAQGKETAKISGTVVDSKTGEPLAAASVYFAGTTIGTSVQAGGNYLMAISKPGNYELVVSMVGYETQKKKFVLIKGQEYIFNIKMVSKPLNITTVEVEGVDQSIWKENLKIFSRKFLGVLGKPGDCTIEKKEYIDFRKNGDTLIAYTQEPIVVVNDYLGYKIVCEIAKFIYDPVSSYYEYSYNTWFHEMKPENESRKERWAAHRETAFYGSPVHFLWALKYNVFDSEGYKIYHYSKDSNWSKNLVKTLNSKDLMNYEQFPDEPVYSFPGYIKVCYKDGDPSYLKLRPPFHFTIDSNGIADNHLPFICSGYWANYGMAGMLPHDYLPESIKNKYDVAVK